MIIWNQEKNRYNPDLNTWNKQKYSEEFWKAEEIYYHSDTGKIKSPEKLVVKLARSKIIPLFVLINTWNAEDFKVWTLWSKQEWWDLLWTIHRIILFIFNAENQKIDRRVHQPKWNRDSHVNNLFIMITISSENLRQELSISNTYTSPLILHLFETFLLAVTLFLVFVSLLAEPRLRLGGGSENAGWVEVVVDGKVGTVCGTDWNTDAAKTACRQMGFSEGIPES